MDSLNDVADSLPSEMNEKNIGRLSDANFAKIARSFFENESEKQDNIVLQQFNNEHKKSLFFESFQKDFAFEYSYDPSVLKISSNGAKILGTPQDIVEPEKRRVFWDTFGRSNWSAFSKLLFDSQHNNDTFSFCCEITVKGQKRPCKIKALQVWNRLHSEKPLLMSLYGCVEFLNK